jgi:hypothetical protein
MTFVSINVNMCEPGFHHLFALYCVLWGCGGWGLGGSAEGMVEQYPSFFLWCFTVTVSGGVGVFVPVGMVMEKGCYRCLVFLKCWCVAVNTVMLYYASVR